ncbi:MAG: 30S ribosomal protein S5, partial [Rubrobacter sp.]|nr:30S ribosomal protein S5 [Rubrobacter sp.]
LTKALGSTTPVNLVKATEDGLKQLRTKAQIEQIRGVKVRL